jgi:NNP family nitrate/nitrite transporter-like MFS transporter
MDMESGFVTTYEGVEATNSRAIRVLSLSTLAFTVNFACWMMYGVLITYLIINRMYDWDKTQIGWLIGIPVLTGAVLRLPAGVLTDMYGGRKVFTGVMLLAAIPMYMVSMADSFWAFFFLGLGFGLSGSTFAVGIAYTSVWFEKKRQGTALGIFGAGNAGAALTAVFAPILLSRLTDNGANLEGWRTLPQLYAAMLVIVALLFWVFTYERKVSHDEGTSLRKRLEPLREIRVWRFGFYYFLVFGGFVALAQWLVPYYVNVYTLSIATAGLLTAVFSFPSGVIRALGGWMSDRWGARKVMYWILIACLGCSLMLLPPKMDVTSPGEGVMAVRGGIVTDVDNVNHTITIDNDTVYNYDGLQPDDVPIETNDWTLLPVVRSWQEPIVFEGQQIERKQLLAEGVSHISFEANIGVFTIFVFIIGIMMGIGKAAVYKYIPDHFPEDVGVVGGIVGVLGGLGGFVCPVIFGYLLEWTGLWTVTWAFFAIISAACLIWMHLVIKKMVHRRTPEISRLIEEPSASFIPSVNIHCPSLDENKEIRLRVKPSNPPSMTVEWCQAWERGICPPGCTMQCITEHIPSESE